MAVDLVYDKSEGWKSHSWNRVWRVKGKKPKGCAPHDCHRVRAGVTRRSGGEKVQDWGGCRLQSHQYLSGDEDGGFWARFNKLFMGFMPTVKEEGPGDTEDRHRRKGIMEPVSPPLPPKHLNFQGLGKSIY